MKVLLADGKNLYGVQTPPSIHVAGKTISTFFIFVRLLSESAYAMRQILDGAHHDHSIFFSSIVLSSVFLCLLSLAPISPVFGQKNTDPEPVQRLPGTVQQARDDLEEQSGRPIDPRRFFAGLEPDPLDASGDELYAIYRKGLITRHISSNGRFLEEVALESVDDFDAASLSQTNAGILKILQDKALSKVPIDSYRYSMEITADSVSEPKPVLWVPMVLPKKDPGLSNDGYDVVSTSGDNPLYYGGLALATFSLEELHGVSEYSICYARKLANYFLASEMTQRNGYIVRRPNFFDSNRNQMGEPIIQGASLEELLGLFLGSMYYIRAEEHYLADEQESPHLVKCDEDSQAHAIAELRQRVLHRIPDKTILPDSHKHPFMSSHHDSSYPLSHFRVPYANSMGEPGGITTAFFGSMNMSADPPFGASAKFENYMMYLTSIVLILEGDYFKEIGRPLVSSTAYSIMDHYIREAVTEGPDKDALSQNAYMGVVAKLVNRYLDDNIDRKTEFYGEKWHSIWNEKDARVWRRLMRLGVDFRIANAQSLENSEWTIDYVGNEHQWQHNLPLVSIKKPKEDQKDLLKSYEEDLPGVWKDHNPHRRIGGFFAWKFKTPVYRRKLDRWIGKIGPVQGWDSPGAISLNEELYKSTSTKKFSRWGHLLGEVRDNRNHRDNQVEGAGLGLTFLRMLLTEINAEKYPAPVLPDKYDRNFDVLPWPGVTPMHPESLDYATDASLGRIGGDTNQSMRVVALGDDADPNGNFVVLYADKDEKLKIVPAAINEDAASRSPIIRFATNDSLIGLGSRFDKLEARIAPITFGSEQVLVVAERAEQKRRFFCDKHWLRMSLWRVGRQSEGEPGYVIEYVEGRWPANEESAEKYCDAVENLDMAMLDDGNVVVLFRNHKGRHVLRHFGIDYTGDNPSIALRDTLELAQKSYDEGVAIASAFGNILIYNVPTSKGFKIETAIFDDGEIRRVDGTDDISKNELLDLATVKRFDPDNPNSAEGYSVVAVGRNSDNYLWVRTWVLSPNGRLAAPKTLDTSAAEDYLLGRESDWEHASIRPVYWFGRPGFVIAGKGAAREVYTGSWETSAKGIKLLYGYVLPTGAPTIESSSVIGSGKSHAGRSIDVTTGVSHQSKWGVLLAHRSYDDKLYTSYWQFRDKFEGLRWKSASHGPTIEPPLDLFSFGPSRTQKVYTNHEISVPTSIYNAGPRSIQNLHVRLHGSGLSVASGGTSRLIETLGPFESRVVRWSFKPTCNVPATYKFDVWAGGTIDGLPTKDTLVRFNVQCIRSSCPPGQTCNVPLLPSGECLGTCVRSGEGDDNTRIP